MSAHEFGPKEADITESDHSGGGSDSGEDAFIYHHDIREQLFKKAAGSVGGTYDHEPLCGLKPFDVTAVHEDQLPWGEDIEHRAVELLMFDPSGGESEPKKAIGHLKYDGKIVVDYRQEPVQTFLSLPLVISSKAEGWRIEGWMRSEKRIGITDIVARISVVVTMDPAEHRSRGPEYQAETLRERAKKFRHLTGLVS